MIVQWQWHKVLSTVKTIHEDITQQICWLDYCSVTMTYGSVNSQHNPWGHNTAERMIVQWKNYTQLCQQTRQSMRTTQQTCWGDDCSVTTTHSCVNSQDNPWRHNTADMLRRWLFSDNYTGFCQQSWQSMKTQHSRHVEGTIVQWQLHRVLSTVKAIHEGITLQTGWLDDCSRTAAHSCQQSRQSMRTTQQTCWGDDCSVTSTQSSVNSPVSICLQWMHTNQSIL